MRAVYRVLDELPVDDRLAFTLHHIEGEKLEVVARLCRCSCATAKRRIARAQQAIEERMGDGAWLIREAISCGGSRGSARTSIRG